MDGLATPEPAAAAEASTVAPAVVTLFVCDTCRYGPEQREHEGRMGGVHFAEQIESRLREAPIPGLQLQRVSCLMACSRHCAVHVRSAGKLGYFIGDFAPDAASAMTLLDYIQQYADSDTGRVPYRSWPEAIKGHFIARTPP
jgi:predicted metal-binding protein